MGGQTDITKPPAVNIEIQRFGDYELLGEIAQGGMGVVYYARQVSLNRTVALKLIRSGQLASEAEVQRFHNEAEAAANLDHPNIVPIYEVGAHEGRHYFSMKLMEGGTLADSSAECGVRDEKWLRRVAQLVATVARAVHHAHQRGVLHRDLKPTNILLDEQGEPHLTDFGLAKLIQDRSNVTQSLAVLGTPGYMSPEQAAGRVKQLTTAADIYGLGAVLYDLLTGRAPFNGDSALEILKQVQEREPPHPQKLNPRVDRDLATICLKCLAKQPEARYATAQAMAEDLERFLRDEPIQARPAPVIEKIGRWCRRKPALAAALASVALALLAGLAGVLWQWRRAEAYAQSETRHRQRAEAASFRLTCEKAENLFDQDRTPNALAYLARLLRQHPTNEIIAARIRSALSLRGFSLPVAALQHTNRITSLQFSPDGQRVLTASMDGTARVWESANGRELAVLNHDKAIMLASWSPDSRRVLTASADKTARVWNLAATGMIARASFVTLGAPLTHAASIEVADFSPRGDRIITGSRDKTARIWDAETGGPLTGPLVHSGELQCVKFSPDGTRVVTVAAGRMVRAWDARVWNARTGAPEGAAIVGQRGTASACFTPDGGQLLLGYRAFFETGTGKFLRAIEETAEQNTYSAEFSRDGQRLLTGSGYFVARIWDCQTGTALSPPMRHDNYVLSAAWSPDERCIVTASRDNTTRIWDQAGRPAGELMRHPGPVSFAGFNSAGTRLATRSLGNQAWLWSPRLHVSEFPKFQHDGPILSLRFSRDGQRLLSTSADRTARLWHTDTGRAAFSPLEHLGWVDCAGFSPDEKLIVTAAQDGRVLLWNAATGQLTGRPFQHRDHARWAEFSPDGRWVLTASFDSTAQVWDAGSREPVGKRIQHRSRVQHAHFSPDGRRVVTASSDPSARVWDAATGEPISPPLSHSQMVLNARFTLDGQRVVTVSEDRTARVWNAFTGEPLTPPIKHSDGLQRGSPDFHPDGRKVVTAGGNSALIWDLTTGKPVTEPLTHSGVVRAAVFSPDGSHVATASADKTARIWDAATGLAVSDPLIHESSVAVAQFSPDGCWLATGDQNGNVTLWEVPRAENPIPEWLADLAVAAGGLRFNADNTLEDVPIEELLRLRRSLECMAGTNSWSVWAKWFCAENAVRPFWPSFHVAPSKWGKSQKIQTSIKP